MAFCRPQRRRGTYHALGPKRRLPSWHEWLPSGRLHEMPAGTAGAGAQPAATRRETKGCPMLKRKDALGTVCAACHASTLPSGSGVLFNWHLQRHGWERAGGRAHHHTVFAGRPRVLCSRSESLVGMHAILWGTAHVGLDAVSR